MSDQNKPTQRANRAISTFENIHVTNEIVTPFNREDYPDIEQSIIGFRPDGSMVPILMYNLLDLPKNLNLSEFTKQSGMYRVPKTAIENELSRSTELRKMFKGQTVSSGIFMLQQDARSGGTDYVFRCLMANNVVATKIDDEPWQQAGGATNEVFKTLENDVNDLDLAPGMYLVKGRNLKTPMTEDSVLEKLGEGIHITDSDDDNVIGHMIVTPNESFQIRTLFAYNKIASLNESSAEGWVIVAGATSEQVGGSVIVEGDDFV